MNTSFEDIMNFLTKRITKVSVIAGSFSYNILAAVSYKLLDIVNKLYAITLNSDVDTADSESLDQLASNQGLTRKPATPGVLVGEFNAELPLGARFSNSDFVWKVTSFIRLNEFYYYYLTSEDTGSAVNKCSGDLKAITYIENLTIARIVEISTLGEDTESDDDLRQRYKDSFKKKEFAGNKQAYISAIKEINGVGGVKIYPIWNGGGTVKAVVTDSEYHEPTQTLIQTIQEIIDPSKDGQGLGMAPIGAKVTIAGVSPRNILIGLYCEYKSGTFDDWKEDIKEIINNYFRALSEDWENETSIVIRSAELISRLIDYENISDVLAISINGLSGNLTIGSDEIPVLEDVGEIND